MTIAELKLKLTKWENEISFSPNSKVLIYLEKNAQAGYYDVTDIGIIDQNEISIDADFKYID